MTKQEFQNLVSRGPLILDGATGSNLMKAGMPKGVCTEQWILEHPAALTKLQQEYVDAGSQIIYAPTFAANRISLKEHGLEDEMISMISRLVSLSKSCAKERCYVAGDLTTTGKTDIPYEELYNVYQEQISCLADAGADLLVAETMMTLDETMAAVEAAHAVCGLPILCSLTIESDGSLFFGGNIFETAVTLQEIGADAVGINCSSGPDQFESIISSLKDSLTVPVIAKPNAGMPTIDEKGEAHYSMDAPEFARHMKRLVELGADIVGGCCGTTPEFIRELVKILKKTP
ncbi:homocysteine S-methyltransferase family protein [Hominisplanchenecus murintestinalis]|jgi:5-methyltetrahydrofolate--homocysteine methyltransferase|uniref:Homocysteine S-methyltransferase family protein n=1 Tax=Hominisplanchenecus murintestinalis TaxID=2941517 RepID=A0AC61R2V8_9FIRM|nr:homocysteine S-methyltransferase family protein [Hominisplanchenecus murintestinalis]NBH96883.1 homocysteine S-methyltransferase family protein [Lachnospiraceae bacterium]NBI73904.1 homocysteine S-methyltransferase family protein [Lachnospiraceae bacterium]RKK00867.1 homocysteine S-methyltransferase family protein [Anaerotruncus sp. 1XD22-93]TGX99740.1 homocysteine S-methyltransferase family protein [Hominisplanchenecus murintestinalis]